MTHRRLAAALVVSVIALGALAGPATAVPAGPDAFAHAQVGLTYTVYAPKVTFGITPAKLRLYACGAGRDEMLTVAYGIEGSSPRSITVNESQKGCVDGPDGVAPAATFTVDGAKATVKGECAIPSPCRHSTLAGVRKFAYTTVTLPAASGLGTTYLEVYSQGLSLAQIKSFVNGLTPVQ